MENLQLAAPEFPARVNLGRRRTGSPRPANDNGPSLVAAVADAAPFLASSPATVLAAFATPAMPAIERRFGTRVAAWITEWAARRTINVLRSWPDDRLARAGIRRGAIAATVRERFGLSPLSGAGR